MQVCTSLQTDNHASTLPLKFFTGRMPFLPLNQQRQSTEGIYNKWTKNFDKRQHRIHGRPHVGANAVIWPHGWKLKSEKSWNKQNPADVPDRRESLLRMPLALGIWTVTWQMVVWVHRVHIPNGISICSSVFVGLVTVTNRHTDRAKSVAIGRILALCACDAAW